MPTGDTDPLRTAAILFAITLVPGLIFLGLTSPLVWAVAAAVAVGSLLQDEWLARRARDERGHR